MVPEKFLGLLNLLKTQALDIYKLIEVIIVCKNKIFKFAVFQEVAPSFKSLNYSQKFLVVIFISDLCRNFYFKEKTIRYY